MFCVLCYICDDITRTQSKKSLVGGYAAAASLNGQSDMVDGWLSKV